MASAASGLMIDRTAKAFDFGSEEVLCSYNEFSQESADGVISDPATGKDFSKGFQKSRKASYSPAAVNNQLEESHCRDTVEKCMKRHTEDIMRVLEGISSRLSHLELYCYNVDKSVGEMRLDLRRDYEETEFKLKSLEKHLGEVSRSVQILRDKQELAETQEELTKLQRAQVELSSPNACRHDAEQRSTSPTSDQYKTDDTFEAQNQHLAIVLHHQVAPQQQLPPTRHVASPQPIAPAQSAPQRTTQPQHFYVASSPYQMQVQAPQGQYLTTDAQYQNPQPLQQDFNLVRLQPVSQSPPQVHQFIQTRQQTQQPQYMMSAQQSIRQPPTPAQSRPQSASGHPSNQPSQSMHQAPQEAMHASFSSMPQHVMVTRAEVMPNGYCGKPMPQLQHLPQMIANYGSMSGDIYTSVGPRQSLTPATAATYMMYGNEQARRQPTPQSQFPQNCPPTAAPLQHPQQVSIPRNPNQPQLTRNCQYNDLINELLNMGFGPEHVTSVVHNMVETGQPVDFNAVLNKLNAQSSNTHRPWTG